MLIRRTVIGLALALLVALPVPAWADIQQDVAQCRDPISHTKIGACTRLIQSGRFGHNNLAIIFYNRGNAYIRKRQHDRAIRDYDAAILLKPNYANAFFNRGHVYGQKGLYDRAIRDYTKVIRLRPRHANAYGNRGWVYEKLGRRNKAIADYRKAIMLRPGDRAGTGGLKRLGVTP